MVRLDLPLRRLQTLLAIKTATAAAAAKTITTMEVLFHYFPPGDSPVHVW